MRMKKRSNWTPSLHRSLAVFSSPPTATHQLEFPALGGGALQVEMAGQEIEPLGVLALRGTEAVLEIEGRCGLVVELRLDRGGHARELGVGAERPLRVGGLLVDVADDLPFRQHRQALGWKVSVSLASCA